MTTQLTHARMGPHQHAAGTENWGAEVLLHIHMLTHRHTCSHTPLLNAVSLKLSTGSLYWEELMAQPSVGRKWFFLLPKLPPLPAPTQMSTLL